MNNYLFGVFLACLVGIVGLSCRESTTPRGTIIQGEMKICSLKASTVTWGIEMEWYPSSLKRRIRFRKSEGDFGDWFSVELRQRKKNFASQAAGVTSTRSGAYHSGSYVELINEKWAITVDHGINDFASQRDFETYLAWEYNLQEGRYALDGDGNLVVVNVQDDEFGKSFSLSVYKVRINGLKPTSALTTKYKTGNISLKGIQAGG